MSGHSRANLGSALWAVLAICTASTGCHSAQLRAKSADAGLPRELAMVSLPPYRVSPPDILVIDALRLVPRPPYKIEPLDSLLVQFPAKALPEKDQETLAKAGLTVGAIIPVEPDGTIKLGLKYGSVQVAVEIPGRSAVAVRSRIAWLKVDCASQIADTSIQIPHRKSSKASIEPGGREGFIERDRETEIGNGPLQFLFRQPLITALDIRHRRSGSSLAAAQLH